jgi:hypothetical protein
LNGALRSNKSISKDMANAVKYLSDNEFNKFKWGLAKNDESNQQLNDRLEEFERRLKEQ